MFSQPQACPNNQQITWSLLYNNVLCQRQRDRGNVTSWLHNMQLWHSLPWWNAGWHCLTSSECRALHLLPLALSVSQLMFLGNTGHGRRRGVYTSMEASEKMVGMWCNRTQGSYTVRYTQRGVLMSERQNAADFEQLNATASTFVTWAQVWSKFCSFCPTSHMNKISAMTMNTHCCHNSSIKVQLTNWYGPGIQQNLDIWDFIHSWLAIRIPSFSLS